MQSSGPPGFYNAPVSKFLLLSVGGCSLLANVLTVKTAFHLQLTPHLTTHHQFWRLLTHHCAFANSSELFFGGMVLYHLRVIERHFGSSKYAAFLFVSSVISTLLEVGALVSGGPFGLRYIPAGPYSIMFATLYQYHRLVPVTYRFRVFGVTLNDKMYMYVLGLQLLITQFPSGLIAGCCGLLAGALYRSDIGSIKQWRFPSLLRRLAARVLLPILSSSPIARSTATTPEQRAQAQERTFDGGVPGIRNRRGNGAGAEGAAGSVREYIDTLAVRTPPETTTRTGVRPPSSEHIDFLMAMFPGQTRDAVSRALVAAHNDINRAVEIMLSGQPAPGGSQ